MCKFDIVTPLIHILVVFLYMYMLQHGEVLRKMKSTA